MKILLLSVVLLALTGCCGRDEKPPTVACGELPLPPKPTLVGDPQQDLDTMKKHAAELRWTIHIHNKQVRGEPLGTPP